MPLSSAPSPAGGPIRPPDTRYRSLDTWRGLACLMIVAAHAAKTVTDAEWAAGRTSPVVWLLWKVVANLYIGVPLFFVISGYCIAATAESTLRKGGGVGTYFARRVRRILPPYWAACGIALVLVSAAALLGAGRLFSAGDDNIPLPDHLTTLQWLGSLTLTETWRTHLTGGGQAAEQLFFGPSWTLCYEEQFYAVCGLLLWIAPRRLWKGLALVSLATLAAGALSEALGVSLRGFFFDGRWLIFASGLLVYHHLHRASARGRRVLLVSLAAAVVLGVALRYGVLARVADKEEKLLAFEIVVGGAFGLALILLHPRDARLAGLSVVRPLRFCGEMCYSLYLVHWPVTILVSHGLDALGVRGVWPVILVTVPIATGASVALSRVFYHLVERRFLNAPAQPAVAVAGA